MRASIAVLILCALVSGACNSNDNPAAPSSGIPNVAGRYTGSLRWDVDGQRVATFPARMVVQQSGSQLTVAGTLTIEGRPVELTAVTGVINETGFFTATSAAVGGSVDDPTCGLITNINTTLNFSGNTARYVEQDTTQRCGKRWTPSFGQVFVTAKVESGVMIQATLG